MNKWIYKIPSYCALSLTEEKALQLLLQKKCFSICFCRNKTYRFGTTSFLYGIRRTMEVFKPLAYHLHASGHRISSYITGRRLHFWHNNAQWRILRGHNDSVLGVTRQLFAVTIKTTKKLVSWFSVKSLKLLSPDVRFGSKKWSKFDFGWGSAPQPTGEITAPPNP